MTIEDLKRQHGLTYSGRLICPVCGSHKRHSRLDGYHCHNLSHTLKERAFIEQLATLAASGHISQADYDKYCWEG